MASSPLSPVRRRRRRRLLLSGVIVAVVAGAMEFTGRVLQKILRTVGFGWFDRTLGMAFGFGRGCMLSLVALMANRNYAG